MPDYAVGEVNPLLARNYAHQVLLDVAWVVMLRELQSARDAMDVGIDHYSFGLSKPRAQDYVCRLARGSRHGQEPLHVIGHFAAELVHDSLRGSHDRL